MGAVLIPILAALLTASSPTAPDLRLALVEAMEQELTRSRQRLSLKGHESPYFISYQMKDSHQVLLAARYGALFEEDTYRERKLYADVRVGTYAFDSSQSEDEVAMSFATNGPSYVARRQGPIEEDPLALRTSLWLVTDEKYKSALFAFQKKKGDGIYRVEDPNQPPSFTREEPARFVQPPQQLTFQRQRWAPLIKRLSARFNAHPELFDSDVRVTAEHQVRYFVSTEGTRLITESLIYGLHIQAMTRAPDGQLLDNSRNYYAPSEHQLPSDAELEAATGAVIKELLELRVAPAIDPYTGPAILEPPAAGVLFHEAVGHRLEGERQGNDQEGKTFRGQVGNLLLPRFISLFDDPNLKQVGEVPLNGHYLYDEQGVRGQRAQLVERGVLRSYLLSRSPVEGFNRSNGHGRSQDIRQPIARMANLVVESHKQVSDAELKRLLLTEARRQGKPYGLIIRDITGGNTNTSNYGYQAFKGVPRMVYRVDVKDGRETLVRGVEIVGTPLSSINKILATGRKPGVFNGYCGAESGSVPVATVAPATLLGEIELQRAMEGKDRPPLIPSPSADAAAPPAAR